MFQPVLTLLYPTPVHLSPGVAQRSILLWVHTRETSFTNYSKWHARYRVIPLIYCIRFVQNRAIVLSVKLLRTIEEKFR